MGDFWVFGYGSLMWNPGFDHLSTQRARLPGYRRSLCIWSWIYRGTQERPGLVMGLDRGGSCIGLAFRVAAEQREATLAYLREREQVTGVYLERHVRVRLEGGGVVEAVTYVADRHHRQYAGSLDAEHAAAVVAAAAGKAGPNADYVGSTIRHLRELGIRDHWLERVGMLMHEP